MFYCYGHERDARASDGSRVFFYICSWFVRDLGYFSEADSKETRRNHEQTPNLTALLPEIEKKLLYRKTSAKAEVFGL